MEGQEAAAMEGAGEDMMRQMMGEFGKMGEKEVRERGGRTDTLKGRLTRRATPAAKTLLCVFSWRLCFVKFSALINNDIAHACFSFWRTVCSAHAMTAVGADA